MKKTAYFFCAFAISTLNTYVLVACDLNCFIPEGLVIGTQRIVIDEYPYAFNPSIIRWQNKLLMSFRVIPDPAHPFTSWLGLVWLDENFKPCSKPQRLYLRDTNTRVPSRMEDGRLIAVANKLYLIYSDNPEATISKGGFRVYAAQLEYDGNKFFVVDIECFSSFEGNSKKRREKNWVPFDYYGQLMLSYSIDPHKVFQPLPGTGHCETFTCSGNAISWKWGQLRGGTPAIRDGDHYIAFFHSSLYIATQQSRGQKVLHYVMGAYTFKAEPPFNITGISAQPIVAETFYEGLEYKPYWKPVKVVFPCGILVENDYVWVAYGRDDHELWVAKVDKHKLYKNLTNPIISRFFQA